MKAGERLREGGGLVLYVRRPNGAAVGLGKVSAKFKQYKPLWPEEFQRNEVLWPLRSQESL